MAINKIVKHGLESAAIDLRGKDKTHLEISEALSKQVKEKISVFSVQRFFSSYDAAKSQAVEKSHRLQVKVAEAEINTIDEAMMCVTELRDICEKAKAQGDYRTAVLAIDKVYTGLDIVNKVLGKYKITMPDGNPGVNIMFYLPGNNRDEKVVDITDDN